MDLEIITLNETSQKKKSESKFTLISLIRGLWKHYANELIYKAAGNKLSDFKNRERGGEGRGKLRVWD